MIAVKKSQGLKFGILLLSLSIISCTKKAEVVEVLPVKKISNDQVQLTKEAIKNLKIVTAEVSDFPEQLHIMGRITVAEERVSMVPARIYGRIDAVMVASGEEVNRGQPLATIFSSDLIVAREEYLQSVKQYNKTQSETDLNMVNLSRKKFESMGIQRSDVDNIKETTGSSPTMFTIRSPRHGAILKKDIVVGSIVNPGDPMFTVGDLGKVWFAGDLYPEDLAKVHKDQEIAIDIEGMEHHATGKISFISPIVDPTTRTVKLRAVIDNPGGVLRSDMYVRGDITLSKKLALQVPKQAVIVMSDVGFCFKQTKEDVFQRVEVKIGEEKNGKVTILSGLSPNDKIVSEGTLLMNAALNN
jgi:RND family efflux transporter MFP subunit